LESEPLGWDIGGGGVELGESIEHTLKKEILEEYLTEVQDFEFLGYRDVHRVNDGEPTHWISLDFKVRINPATVGVGEPHKFDAVEWFSLDTVPAPEYIHSQLPTFLKKYEGRLS
jgi:8-oxo-dGTP pyrophosphatase MutT (NUDIX family)